MNERKFSIGETVQLASHITDMNVPSGIYEIIRQLPEKDGEYQYSIKSIKEPYSRVVIESDLRKI